MSGKRAKQFRRKAQQAVNRSTRKVVSGIFNQPFAGRADDAVSILAGDGNVRGAKRRLTVAAICAVCAWAMFSAAYAIGSIIW